jgi:AcrR family transcriptional regulator
MTPARGYVSPLREEAAARTRALIHRHAAELFARRGYARVTVADIAAAAGVAPKTVFASAGSKADILNRIVDQAVAESGHKRAVAEVLTMTTPEAVLRSLARGTRLGNESQFTAQEAIVKALSVHEEGEALWERATSEYRSALRTVADHLRPMVPAADSYSTEELADLLWLWFGPSGWRTLVVENGWSWDRAEEALYRSATAVLG